VTRRPTPRRGRSLLLIAGLAVLTAVLLLVLVLRLARDPQAKVNLGDQEFDVGQATTIARPILAAGPLLFQALRGTQLDIFVQHVDPDPTRGWLAFLAHAPGEARTCLLRWEAAALDFSDPCSTRRFPATGDGLAQYATRVDTHGHVIVNLRASVGTTPPSTR